MKRNGITVLPVEKRHRYRYGHYGQLTSESSPYPKRFQISVEYNAEGSVERLSEVVHVHLMDFWGSLVERSELHEHAERLAKSIDKLTKQVERSAERIADQLARITTPTGVTLSVTALRNLRNLLNHVVDIEKFDPRAFDDYNVFSEVLGVSSETAFNIWKFFRGISSSSFVGFSRQNFISEHTKPKILICSRFERPVLLWLSLANRTDDFRPRGNRDRRWPHAAACPRPTIHQTREPLKPLARDEV
jgi:hypothetical protein